MTTATQTVQSQESLVAPRVWGLWLCVGFIVSLGVVLVYSSSAARSAGLFGDPSHFLELHLIRLAMGFALAWGATRVPIAWWRAHAPWVLGICLLLLVSVLIPGIGATRGGARRWISLMGFGFQPSEIAKVGLVLVMSAILVRRDTRKRGSKMSLLTPVLIAQIPVILVLAEPDLGTALVMELTIGVLVFVAGLKVRAMATLALLALPVFYHLIASTPWRLRRLLAFIDPWAYRHTVGYQLTEALISIGSGGVTGLGVGEGRHGLFFLPEAHTDFIFAILGQELGLLGVLSLLGAFVALVWLGLGIAGAAKTNFGRYVAVGLTALFGVPALFNTAVVTGLLPTKGLPLPLVSYGGSNLMMCLGAIGILTRIAMESAEDSASQGARP